jgi:hypothetical protein
MDKIGFASKDKLTAAVPLQVYVPGRATLVPSNLL